MKGRWGFEEETAGFGVDCDFGKAREEAITEEAVFSCENGFRVETGRNLRKIMFPQRDAGLDLRD